MRNMNHNFVSEWEYRISFIIRVNVSVNTSIEKTVNIDISIKNTKSKI